MLAQLHADHSNEQSVGVLRARCGCGPRAPSPRRKARRSLHARPSTVPCHAHAATAAPTTFKKRLEQLFQQQQ